MRREGDVVECCGPHRCCRGAKSWMKDDVDMKVIYSVLAGFEDRKR